MIENVFVRALTKEELPLLLTLFDYNDEADMLSQNRVKMERGEIEIFGLFREDELIGELRVAFSGVADTMAIPGKRAYLYAFRVREGLRGFGYGRGLLKSVIKEMAERGYKELTVGVEDDNKRAKGLYSTFEFRDVIERRCETYQGDSYEYNLYIKRL